MAVNDNAASTTGSSRFLTTPPNEPGKAYALQSFCGEIIYIPHSKSAMRLLVTGKESENAFAIVGTGGSEGDPIGYHYHREAHDVFLCLEGRVNVWSGETGRTMFPGDFASVPPVRPPSPALVYTGLPS
jgi:quercetin dioxygenase-like cupin family protein